MNKAELVAKVATKLDLTKASVANVLEEIVTSVKEAVKAGDKVSLIGFGSLEAKQKAARVGRNPQTGKEIKIPARTVIRFKAGKALTEFMNK